MSSFNHILKISLIGTLTLIPYVTSIQGSPMPQQAKNSMSDNQLAILGSERRQERRDDRQDRRDDRQDNRQGYDRQSSEMPSTQTPN
jgi:hypothetical protein